MRLWAIYIFPLSVSLFCWRKYVDRSWYYINCSQTHECWNWGWGRAIPRKGIYKGDFRCSVPGMAAWVCREAAEVDKRADLARLLWFSDDICFSIICYFAAAVGDDSSSLLSGLWHIAADAAMPLQLPWKYRICSHSSPLLHLSSARRRSGPVTCRLCLLSETAYLSGLCDVRGGGERKSVSSLGPEKQ